jgi:hypothetical protein
MAGKKPHRPKRTGSKRHNIQPTGKCACGCGWPTNLGKFWVPGHDSLAKEAVIAIHHGDVVDFLHDHGYGPKGKDLLYRDADGKSRYRTEAIGEEQ